MLVWCDFDSFKHFQHIWLRWAFTEDAYGCLQCARLLLHQAPAAAQAPVDQRRGCQVYCPSSDTLLEVKKLMQRPSQALGQEETESCQLFLLSSSRSSGCGVSSNKAEMVLIKAPWKMVFTWWQFRLCNVWFVVIFFDSAITQTLCCSLSWQGHVTDYKLCISRSWLSIFT